jgi:hypothetical protein
MPYAHKDRNRMGLRRRFYGTNCYELEEQERQRFEKRRQQWEQATDALFEAMPDGYKPIVKEIDSASYFLRQKATSAWVASTRRRVSGSYLKS